MKPIEITEEQKNKLLEMCKKLFPEYKRIEVYDYQIDIERDHYNPYFVDLYKGKLKVPYDIYSIHWFEFCYMFLKPKIFDLLSPNFLINDRNFNKWNRWYTNPIDYLYVHFKKIK